MKTALTLAALLLSNIAFADAVSLPKGSKALSTITPIVTNTAVMLADCPFGHTCPAHTTITLQFSLLGCVDTLGPVSYLARPSTDGGADLYVSGINIHNEMSERVDCRIAPPKYVYVTVEGAFFSKDEIRVHALDVK